MSAYTTADDEIFLQFPQNRGFSQSEMVDLTKKTR